MHTRVLFVCLGNICRSPTAEGVFTHVARRRGIAVRADSAGTGSWHVGDPPDARAIAAATARGYDISGLRARQVSRADFERFDLILGMDESNIAALERLRPADAETPVEPFLRYAPGPEIELPDPYYDGGFERMIELVEKASAGLLDAIEAGMRRSG